MKNCNIIIHDEVNCTIMGLSDNDLDTIRSTFSRYAPGYQFSPRFKLTSWNGKIDFVTAGGKTYIKLLDDIIPLLCKLGYLPTLDDRRKATNVPSGLQITKDIFNYYSLPDTDQPLELYDHQVEMVNALLRENGQIGIAATGAGKSYIIAALSHVYEQAAGYRSIIIVPKTDLIIQTLEDFKSLGLDIGEYSGTVKQLSNQHIVTTWQALQNNPALVSQFQVVIVDECHGVQGKSLQAILNDHGSEIPIRMGVTATLPEDEANIMAIRCALGEVLYTISALDLIKLGILATPSIYINQYTEDLTGQYEQYKSLSSNPLSYIRYKNNYFPDFKAEKKYLIQNKTRMEAIADQIIGLNKNTFVLVDSVKYGRDLAKIIPGAVFLNGADKGKVRKEIYNQFKDNDDMIVIATSQIAYAGLNIKRIFNLVLIDMGKSFIRVMQSIGRGLRKAKDKETVNIFDICGDLKYGKKHLTERRKIYTSAGYEFETIQNHYNKKNIEEI